MQAALRARSWKEWGAPEAGLSPRAPPADSGRDPVSLFRLSPDFSLFLSFPPSLAQSHLPSLAPSIPALLLEGGSFKVLLVLGNTS